jgi:rhomboid protease GluP
VLIGIFDRPSIFIEKNIFHNQTDFTLFQQKIELAAQKNSSQENYSAITFIAHTASLPKKNLACFFFVALWIVLYLVTSGLSDTTRDYSLLSSGITKTMFIQHETYRIATSFFTHISIFHLLFNILAFSVIGTSLEIFLGKVRFINAVLVTAVVGSVFSFFFSPYSLVVGGSGGVYGLFGVYLFINFKYHKSLPGSIASMPRAYIIGSILAEIAFETYSKGIDSYSHIGGFIFGVLYAYLFSYNRTSNELNKSTAIEKIAGTLIFSFYLINVIYFLCYIL